MNAATNFAPETALPLMVSFAAMGVLALVVAVATRGRLGYTGPDATGPTGSRPTQSALRVPAAS